MTAIIKTIVELASPWVNTSTITGWLGISAGTVATVAINPPESFGLLGWLLIFTVTGQSIIIATLWRQNKKLAQAERNSAIVASEVKTELKLLKKEEEK